MRRQILQVLLPHDGVANLAGAFLQLCTSHAQKDQRARIPACLKRLVASQINPQRIVRAIQIVRLQETENRFDVCQGLRQVALSQRDARQASHRFHRQVNLVKFSPYLDRLPVSRRGLFQLPQVEQNVTQVE